MVEWYALLFCRCLPPFRFVLGYLLGAQVSRPLVPWLRVDLHSCTCTLARLHGLEQDFS